MTPLLRLEHYRKPTDPWPYVIGFACGVITSGLLLVVFEWGLK
jgi:hypothetical protein